VTHHFVVPTVANAVDLVVHLGVTPSGERQVREIVAVTGRVEEDRVETAGLFHRQPQALGGRLVRGDGFPAGEDRFTRAGIDVHALLAAEAG
jgi:pilus assembly protein CpaF